MSSESTYVDLGLGEVGLSGGCTEDAEPCGCAASAGAGCHCRSGGLERPRWFGGQLVGPADLEALQQWVLARSRRHNRLLHGWGVVCGLAVKTTTDPVSGEAVPWSVTIGEGLALSSCGDEVALAGPVRVDIRQPQPAGSEGCAPPVDPWCAPVRQRRNPDRSYYLAIRYAEEQRRPVRSSAGCGCDDDPCEYSRIAETVAFAVLEDPPACYPAKKTQASAPAASLNALVVTAKPTVPSTLGCSPEIRKLGTRPCPTCCSPWVVLATLQVSADGAVEIDPLAYRRFVTIGHYFACEVRQPEPDPPPEKALVISHAARTLIGSAFTEAAADIAENAQAATILAQPATLLRGGRRSNALQDLLAGLTVAELAALTKPEVRQAARERGLEPSTVEVVYERSRVVADLAGMELPEANYDQR